MKKELNKNEINLTVGMSDEELNLAVNGEKSNMPVYINGECFVLPKNMRFNEFLNMFKDKINSKTEINFNYTDKDLNEGERIILEEYDELYFDKDLLDKSELINTSFNDLNSFKIFSKNRTLEEVKNMMKANASMLVSSKWWIERKQYVAPFLSRIADVADIYTELYISFDNGVKEAEFSCDPYPKESNLNDKELTEYNKLLKKTLTNTFMYVCK